MLRLSGPQHSHFRLIEREFGVGVGQRGQALHLQGPAAAVAQVEKLLAELQSVLLQGNEIGELEIVRTMRTLRDHPQVRLRELFSDVVLVAADKRPITPKGVAQQQYIQAIRDFDIVFGVGPAGTGKTYLAMAMAVKALIGRRVKRIILTRPAVEAGEKLGFLPGDLAEKVNPYLRPLYDALHDMMDVSKVRMLLEKGTIEVAPLAFMRGRTLDESFVILDEAQNTTPEQMRMFLTRLGFASKTVITGDVTQVDLPDGQPSGLRDAIELLDHVPGITVCAFSDADVVRHPLVQSIIQAYDHRDADRRARTRKVARLGAR